MATKIASMTVVAWVILLVLVLPMLGLLLWAVLRSSFVRVPSGSLGLLLIKGRATDKSMLPGAHFVPALRRHMAELYPSVELTFRADGGVDDSPLTSSAPPLTVTLGDRTTVTVTVTVRFRLMPDQLRVVHERFGPQGVFTIVRDETNRAVQRGLGAPDIGVKDLLGASRETTESALAEAVALALGQDGIELRAFALGSVDLGRTGEVVQAISRATYELEREETEAQTRLAQARNDAVLQQLLQPGGEAAWRYRNPALLRELAPRAVNFSLAVPVDRTDGPAQPDRPAGPGPAPNPPAEPTAVTPDQDPSPSAP
jgi:regulator of protease activity HflC (stomatin/prohibitin superfamily)